MQECSDAAQLAPDQQDRHDELDHHLALQHRAQATPIPALFQTAGNFGRRLASTLVKL